MGHFLEERLGGLETETARIKLVLRQAFRSKVELAKLVEEGFEKVPDDDGMKINFVDFMGENGVIVFPAFFDTEQEIANGVSVFKAVESGPVYELVVEGLGRHIVFNFKLLLDNIGFGEPVRELCPLLDFVKVVVVQAIYVECL